VPFIFLYDSREERKNDLQGSKLWLQGMVGHLRIILLVSYCMFDPLSAV